MIAAFPARRKVLVVGPAWVGDMVMAQALFRRLKARAEPTDVQVVGPAFTVPLLERMPEVGRGWVLPVGHGALGLRARLALARDLRREGFDEAIVLPRSWKSALVPFLAGIPVRRGTFGEFRLGLVNRFAPRGTGRTVDAFLALSGDPAPLRPEEAPRLRPEPAGALLDRLGVGDGPFLAFCPGAEYGPAKRWPPEHFAALGRQARDAGLAVLLLGSPRDGEVAAAIARAVGDGAHDLTGRTALGEAVDLLAAARAVVTNDSGLMHVAAAVGRPVVALFGSSSPARTPPLSDRAAAVETEQALACRPCFARTCRFGHTLCLASIAPERVAALALAYAER